VETPTACRQFCALHVVIALVTSIAGCNGDTSLISHGPRTFSDVYARFDPEAEFERLGFKVDADPEGGAISPRWMYGWRQFQGSLELPNGRAGCDPVATAIRQSLESTAVDGGVDELNRSHPAMPTQRLHEILRYESQGMTGHVYIWLFADKSATKIDYAILLCEEYLPSHSASADLAKPTENSSITFLAGGQIAPFAE
jgi:hypothetical protein